MISAVLMILGLAFGSFVNALVYRLHERDAELSISKGRSICPHCQHRLSAADLVPVASWIALRGKCRYCGKPISWQYPAVELSTALLFVLSYAFWSEPLNDFVSIMQFSFWLVFLTGFVALVVYDLRYMLLPNRIIFPLTGLAVTSVAIQFALSLETSILTSAALSVLIGGGLFYILFQLSEGRWIGGGDVKLGILIGLVLGVPELSVMMLFVASLLGTIATLPFLLSGRMTPKTRIPFGPFLIAGAVFAQLFGHGLLDLYSGAFI